MKAGTHNHLKVKRLKRLLKLPLYRVVGVLETLWLLCIDCCDEGNIGKFTDEEIADYLEWDGDASELVRALSDSGWTDPDNTGRPIIHDWFEHCPEFIRDRVRKRHARSTQSTEKQNARCKSKTYASDDPDTFGQSRTDTGQDPATTVYGNSIQFNSIPSKAQKRTNGKIRKSKHAEPNGFAEWYEIYPRHVARARAAKAYGTAVTAFMVRDNLERPEAVQALLDVTKQFRTSDAGNRGSFTPEPASWLNAARYFDDPKDWKRTEPNGEKPRSKNGATGAERPAVRVPTFEETRAALGPGQPREP